VLFTFDVHFSFMLLLTLNKSLFKVAFFFLFRQPELFVLGRICKHSSRLFTSLGLHNLSLGIFELSFLDQIVVFSFANVVMERLFFAFGLQFVACLVAFKSDQLFDLLLQL
jgi:hypothetical protein